GFPSVTAAEPLPNASIVAAWDPESLGTIAAAPPDVSASTNTLGQARLDMPVPVGDARTLTLLLLLRHGEHVRTRKIEVSRTPRSWIELRVPDAHVVPGSQVPSW